MYNFKGAVTSAEVRMAQSPLALSGDVPLETDKGPNMDFVWFAPFGIHLNYLGWDLNSASYYRPPSSP